MSDDAERQIDAFTTPGLLLKAGRESMGLSEREAADRLNLMPGYVAIIERDDYQALRSPGFARGYVRSYGRLLGLDEERLLTLFDEMPGADAFTGAAKRVETRPLQLQRTGMGMYVGLGALLLLIAGLWWWQVGRAEAMPRPPGQQGNGAGEQLAGPGAKVER